MQNQYFLASKYVISKSLYKQAKHDWIISSGSGFTCRRTLTLTRLKVNKKKTKMQTWRRPVGNISARVGCAEQFAQDWTYKHRSQLALPDILHPLSSPFFITYFYDLNNNLRSIISLIHQPWEIRRVILIVNHVNGWHWSEAIWCSCALNWKLL